MTIQRIGYRSEFGARSISRGGVTPAVVDHLGFHVQPSDVSIGAPIDPPVVVWALDDTDTIVTGFHGPVTVKIASGGAKEQTTFTNFKAGSALNAAGAGDGIVFSLDGGRRVCLWANLGVNTEPVVGGVTEYSPVLVSAIDTDVQVAGAFADLLVGGGYFPFASFDGVNPDVTVVDPLTGPREAAANAGACDDDPTVDTEGAGELSGTLTKNATAGAVSFDDLQLDSADDFTLLASAASKTVESDLFTVASAFVQHTDIKTYFDASGRYLFAFTPDFITFSVSNTTELNKIGYFDDASGKVPGVKLRITGGVGWTIGDYQIIEGGSSQSVAPDGDHVTIDVGPTRTPAALGATGGIGYITLEYPTRYNMVFDGNSTTAGQGVTNKRYAPPAAFFNLVNPPPVNPGDPDALWKYGGMLANSGQRITDAIVDIADVIACYDATKERNIVFAWFGHNESSTTPPTTNQAAADAFIADLITYCGLLRAAGFFVIACTPTGHYGGLGSPDQDIYHDLVCDAMRDPSFLTHCDALCDLAAVPGLIIDFTHDSPNYLTEFSGQVHPNDDGSALVAAAWYATFVYLGFA